MRLVLIPQTQNRPNPSRPNCPWKGFFRVIEIPSNQCVYWEDCTEEPRDGAQTEEEARLRVEAEIEDRKGSERGLARLANGILCHALMHNPHAALVAEFIAGSTWRDLRVANELTDYNLDGWEGVAHPSEIREILGRLRGLLNP